jgi:DNA ligase-1
MLASKWHPKNEAMFPLWAQPKFDGIRVLIGYDGYAYTRSLKLVRNNVLQSLIRHHKDELAGMDGEIIVGDPTASDCYTRTSSAVMSFENDDISYATIRMFDIWDDPFSYYEIRHGLLKSRCEASYFPDWVQLAEHRVVHNMEELRAYEEELLDLGHEGLILRNPNAFYKEGRGTPTKGELIKLKRFEDTEGEIVAVHERMHNGNEATINALGYTERSGHRDNLVPMDTLGAVEIKLGPEWTSETVRVGSGFNEAQRSELWALGDKLIGKIVKYKYFAVGTKDAPRFPIFLGLRDPDDMGEPESDQMELF